MTLRKLKRFTKKNKSWAFYALGSQYDVGSTNYIYIQLFDNNLSSNLSSPLLLRSCALTCRIQCRIYCCITQCCIFHLVIFNKSSPPPPTSQFFQDHCEQIFNFNKCQTFACIKFQTSISRHFFNFLDAAKYTFSIICICTCFSLKRKRSKTTCRSKTNKNGRRRYNYF